TIKKPIPPLIQNQSTLEKVNAYYQQTKNTKNKLSQEQLIKDLTKEMKAAAKKLDFEKAATLRDIIIEISVNEK
ncbi:MAG: excinuclease ABC subunit B, partial [Mycoplasma sp.]|nr:excinuclease ABC subunit B [Mycoplasma sp.]